MIIHGLLETSWGFFCLVFVCLFFNHLDIPHLPYSRGSFLTCLEVQLPFLADTVTIQMEQPVFCGCVLSLFSHVQLIWTAAHQAPLSMVFSRQEYWSGLLCPPPRYLPDPGIGPTFLIYPALAGRFFTTNVIWEAQPVFYPSAYSF